MFSGKLNIVDLARVLTWLGGWTWPCVHVNHDFLRVLEMECSSFEPKMYQQEWYVDAEGVKFLVTLKSNEAQGKILKSAATWGHSHPLGRQYPLIQAKFSQEHWMEPTMKQISGQLGPSRVTIGASEWNNGFREKWISD